MLSNDKRFRTISCVIIVKNTPASCQNSRDALNGNISKRSHPSRGTIYIAMYNSISRGLSVFDKQPLPDNPFISAATHDRVMTRVKSDTTVYVRINMFIYIYIDVCVGDIYVLSWSNKPPNICDYRNACVSL